MEEKREEWEEEINILDYLNVVVKHRRMIFWTCSATVITAVIISLLLPKIYRATATIMPPKEKSPISDMVTGMGGLAALAGGALGIESGADLYVGILQSRTVTDAIIDRFSLMEVYNQEHKEKARKKLKSNVSIENSKEDIVSITVEDKDPKRVAAMANAFVEELDRLNKRFGITEAGRKRIFLEKRLKEAITNLSRAEENLKEFQKEQRIVVLDEQAKVVVEAAGTIQGEIAATEAELGILMEYSTDESLEVINLKSKIRELKKQLTKIEKGKVPSKTNPSEKDTDLYKPFTEMPDVGLKLFRLKRDVKIQEMIFELLTQQHEMAKIEEAKDTTTIQILDEAVVSQEKTKPRRSLIVALSGAVALMFSIFLSFIFESFERMDNEDKERWQLMKSALRSDVPLIKKE
ncbi:MAG: GNVR domain-containing protein [Thermodesulfobacteriota bacterium]|nr:GNVR domain-containing protein [Thermodesulfobacteriota bacterium]